MKRTILYILIILFIFLGCEGCNYIWETKRGKFVFGISMVDLQNIMGIASTAKSMFPSGKVKGVTPGAITTPLVLKDGRVVNVSVSPTGYIKVTKK